jgi:purine-binding chemotaxis protein CheW
MTSSPDRALCLIFRVGDEHVAIKSEDVQKVTPRPHISRLARLPPHVLGIAQHRGRVITVIDVRRVIFPSLPPSPVGAGPRGDERLLLLERPARHIGLLVDAVDEIETLAVPTGLPAGSSPLLRLAQHKGRALPILDCERLARAIGVTEEREPSSVR